MDNWKLGDEENELFGDDNKSKKGFSIGKIDKGDDLSEIIFNEKKSDKIEKEIPPKKEKNKAGFKKIFYLLLGIAALLSAAYLFKTLFPGNNTNIKLFGLKTVVYKSKVLPENNLLITGYLVNKNKFPVSYVKLNCKLYDTKNIVILTKHVYAGNFISIKKLKKMSNVDVDMELNNKDGKNMSNVEILPNHPIKFTVVFFDINPNSKNYSVSISHFYRIKK
ncbi:MAG: DUF3426 domain-containing protein [bacterium]|jgi:hypothetical protein